MVPTSPAVPSAQTPSETSLGTVALRTADTAVFFALGAALGALALRLPLPLGADVLTVLMVASGVAIAVPAVREQRRRRRAARTAGVPLREWTRFPTVWRPATSRPWGVFTGLFLVQVALRPARGTFGLVASLTGVAVVVLVLVLGRRARRLQLVAAHAAHPGAAVVLTALVELASMRLARWAGRSGVRLPDDLGLDGVLVADADGLVLRGVGRHARPLLRWGWGDVELRRGPHPLAVDAAVLVLTLLGTGQGPGRVCRYDVTLTIRTGYGPVTAEVVDAALAELLSRRPALAGPAPTGGAA